MASRKSKRLVLENFGPIRHADVQFGDLTVVVGPQATGKSIFLQTLKLVQDRAHIHDIFRHFSMVFDDNSAAFLGGYFGKGMADAWKEGESALRWNGRGHSLLELARPGKAKDRHEHVFLIPAQRVMSLANGVTQNFGQFDYGDPYALRYFSDVVHDLLQNEFGAKGELFPQPNRLNAVLRGPIQEHLYGGSSVAVDAKDFTKRLVLKVPGHSEGLPYTAWSAGQREFTPLLLGLYWLCPAGGAPKREGIDWVVVEEPEMGLHPQGIEAVLLLLLELMRRGYRVVLSTHSPAVLDLVWALQEFKKHEATEADVRKLLDIDASAYSKGLASAVLEKDYKVYFFDRDGTAKDISALSPSASLDAEAEWGGLVGFASRAGNVIAEVVNRAAIQPARRAARGKTKTAGRGE